MPRLRGVLGDQPLAMGAMIYTLMDTDTGNLIGTYATEQEALTLMQSAIGIYGTAYADAMVLGREDAWVTQ